MPSYAVDRLRERLGIGLQGVGDLGFTLAVPVDGRDFLPALVGARGAVSTFGLPGAGSRRTLQLTASNTGGLMVEGILSTQALTLFAGPYGYTAGTAAVTVADRGAIPAKATAVVANDTPGPPLANYSLQPANSVLQEFEHYVAPGDSLVVQGPSGGAIAFTVFWREFVAPPGG